MGKRKAKARPSVEAAQALHAAGRRPEALAAYQAVVDVDPRRGAAWQALGVLACELGETARGVAALERAVALDPQDAGAANNLGLALLQAGRAADAVEKFRQALAIEPGYGDAAYNRGLALKALGDLAGAEASYREALALKPGNPGALNNLGNLLAQLERTAEAEACFREALAIAPTRPEAHVNLARLASADGRHDEAEALLRRAIALAPQGREARVNLSGVLKHQGRYAEAEAMAREALAMEPSAAEAHGNLAIALLAQGRHADAEAPLRAAMTLRPDDANARFQWGTWLLVMGRYAEGWQAAEARSGMPDWHALATPRAPRWQGEEIAGKTLLLVGEQGQGDQLMFMRYAGLLAARGATVDLLVSPSLVAVAAGLPGVRRVLSALDDASYDYGVPMQSVPGLVGTTLDTIPAAPYLTADPGPWRERLDARAKGRRKLGLVWTGNPNQASNAPRSLPPEAVQALAALPGWQPFSLQKGEAAEAWLAGEPGLAHVVPLGPELKDFADTAAVILALDLVITVDTSVAHLAGALGKPVWLLLHATPDWRWLLERTDSPWYPTMRLFRQGAPGDWDGVVAAVRQALAPAEAGDAEAPFEAANAAKRAGRWQEAEARYREALALAPGHAGALNNYGNLLSSLGRLNEAEACLRRALALDAVDAGGNLALVLARQGAWEEAIALLKAAAEADPAAERPRMNLAITLADAGRKAEAEAVYRALGSFDALCNLGLLLKGQGRLEEAEAVCRQGLALRPDFVPLRSNLATILKAAGRLEASEACLREALAIDPGYMDAHANLAVTLEALGRRGEAEAHLRTALARDPQHPLANYNLGYMLLSGGRLAEGWARYEARKRLPHLVRLPRLPFPEWQGEEIAGKTLLLVGEQGLGDMIQFARYAGQLARRGATVDVLAAPALVEVIRRVRGVRQVVTSEPTGGYDCWCLALSAPHRLGTTLVNVPAELPYMSVDGVRYQAWQARLGGEGRKVGLVWAGNPDNPNDRARSTTLDALAPLLDVPGWAFYSLQKGPAEAQLAGYPQVQALGPELRDLADTAAAIACLDLVITVDTAVAHLAGAIGKPVWLLLSTQADWRWLRDRTDSPWYLATRLFRQETPGDWGPVVADVALALASEGGATDAEALACFEAGKRLKEEGRLPEAEASYRRAIWLAPYHVASFTNLGNMMRAQQRLDEAETYQRRALALDPSSAAAHNNLGTALMVTRADESEALFRRAIALQPGYAEAHGNLGILLMHLGRRDEARQELARAVELKPDYHVGRFNLAHLDLQQGRLLEGWLGYEARRADKRYIEPTAGTCALWDGEDLHGKSILLVREQGLGDQLQFIRFATRLAARGATVDAWVSPELAGLVAGVPGLRQVLVEPPDPKLYDYWAPLPGLPLRLKLGLDDIPGEPYLTADPARVAAWRARLESLAPGRRRVGLVWAGNPTHGEERFRSLTLSALAPLVGKAAFFSIQKGLAAEAQLASAPPGLVTAAFGAELTDFSDTAALITALDLVITIDTSVAHAAGALGKPVWVLLDASPDWRWLLDRTDSPWYASARLFRQRTRGDWGPVLAELAAALAPDAEAAFERGNALKRAGRLPEAEASYRQALAADPRHGAALTNLGNMLAAAGRAEEAVGLLERALAASPTSVASHANLAIALQRLGRFDDAGRYFQAAAVVAPDDARAHFNVGIHHQGRGELAAAEAAYRRAVAIEPDNTDVLCNLANLLKETERLEEAEAVARRVVALAPDSAPFLNNLGVLLKRRGRLDEAMAALEKAIALDPLYGEAYGNLAAIHREREHPEAAAACLEHALTLLPDSARIHANLALVRLDQERMDDAEALAARAVALDPRHANGYVALAMALESRGQDEAAMGHLRTATALDPRDVMARYNMSHIELRHGDYANGWPHYALRRAAGLLEAPVLPFPEWQGEDLAGKRLLLVREQGFGDQLQFIRFAADLQARGATVEAWTRPPLAALFARAKGVSRAMGEPPTGGQYDCWAFMLDVPWRLGVTVDTIPASVPYFDVDPERQQAWRERLDREAEGRPKIGLVWAGSRKLRHGKRRAMTPGDLAPLLAVPGACFFSLQAGEGDRAPAGMVDLGPELTDFHETAAAILALDLVITVDTAVAHLAGALGKPTWVMLPSPGDWRWLLDRPDSPWYPTVRLFRQRVPDAWAPVVADVVAALRPAPPADRAFDAAVAFKREGRLLEAEASYREVLRLDPTRLSAWINLGNLLSTAERAEEGEACLRRALELSPDNALIYGNMALALDRQDRLDEAEASLRRSLALAPDVAQPHFNLGAVLVRLDRVEEARASYRRALALDPHHTGAMVNLANLAKEAGDLEEAEALLRRVLPLAPTWAEAHNNLGTVLKKAGRPKEAEACYRQALALAPTYVEPHANLGNLLAQENREAEAIESYRRALALAPDHLAAFAGLGTALIDAKRYEEAEALAREAVAADRPDARQALALALKEQGKLSEAEAVLREALTLDPEHAGTYNNLALLLRDTGRLEDAEAAARRSLALDPMGPGAHASLGWILKELGREDEAEESLRHALALDPDFHTAGYNLGHLLLLHGKLDEGWAAYERRLKLKHIVRPPVLPFPEWQGEEIAGKRLLLVREQGLGDQVQFIRYAAVLAGRGAIVDALVAPEIEGLLAGVAGVNRFVKAIDPTQYDLWTMVMSVPHKLGPGATIPEAPYLTPDPERVARWGDRLAALGPAPRVGLVWGGNPAHKNDANRSMPLSALAPLARVEGVTFVSLQKGPPAAQLADAPFPLHDLGAELADFADTAAAMEHLDLVIAVDTSVVHVAGALGKEAWLLLNAHGDWRWLQDRTDSPWYPGVRIFRQGAGGWEAVAEAVARALEARGRA